MATDYDSHAATSQTKLDADSLEGLKAAEASNSSMDDDGEIVDSFEPPLMDVSGEEINVSVVPRKDDEFHVRLLLPGPVQEAHRLRRR